MQFTLADLDAAADLVHRHMAPTPQYAWPQLAARTGAEVWVKHENHGPIGAFKVRGAITFIDWLRRTHPDCPGIITATRGNHGQAQARAATRAGLRAVVYAPHGNSVEKNTAMRAFGADLREFGADFDAAKDEAMRVATSEGLFPVPPFPYRIGARRGDLRVRVVQRASRSRRGLCAHRLRVGDLRDHRGA